MGGFGDGRKIEQVLKDWLEEVEKQVNTIEEQLQDKAST